MGQRSTRLRLAILVAALWCGGALPARAGAEEPRLEFAQALGAPGRLDDRVRFWVDVFTRWSVGQAIVQDRDRPWVVFAVVPIEKPNRQELSRVRSEYVDLAHRLHRALAHPGAAPSAALLGERGEAWRRLLPPVEPAVLAEARDRIEVRPGQREIFLDSLSRSRPLVGTMKRLVRDAGLPEEIAYLPHVESSFNAEARSNVGAVGIWQLMPETARRTLRVDHALDERRDPVRSTHAATRYFREAYDALGSWPLAVTSYNYGVNGMRRAVETLGTSDLVELIDRHDSPAFGYSAKNFFAQFLAAVHVARHEDSYFPPRSRALPPRPLLATANAEQCRATGATPVLLAARPRLDVALAGNGRPSAAATPAPVRLAAVARAEGGDARARRAAATWRREASPRATGHAAPGGRAPEAPAASADARATREHVVQRGDSLWTIARRHGTTVEAIRSANRDVSSSARLQLGQRLLIEG